MRGEGKEGKATADAKARLGAATPAVCRVVRRG